MVQGGAPGCFEIPAPGRCATRSFLRDVEVGEESLLSGVEAAVGGALLVEPGAEIFRGAGESAFGGERLSGLCQCFGAVVDALPPQVPGRVPPRVEGVEGGGAFGSELRSCGPLVGEPQADGESVDPHRVGRAQVAVLGGIGTGMAQSTREPSASVFGAVWERRRLGLHGCPAPVTAFRQELGDRGGPVGWGDAPHAARLRFVPGTGADTGAHPGVQRPGCDHTEATGDPRPLKTLGQFVDEVGDIGERVRLMPARLVEQPLLYTRIRQGCGQCDGFGIGDRVPRRRTPCEAVARGRQPQSAGPDGLFRPGLVPP